jgi:two-component system, cell cycle response regulator DivK
MNQNPAVLYIEDDTESREVMEVLLIHVMGLSNVSIFEDSTDFLARAKQLQPRPDVVLLDIHIRPHDGFEMLRAFRKDADFRSVPIVALTASVMNEEVQRLRQAGFSGTLAKPLDMDTFPAMLARLLSGENIWRI